jgi:hypothetical protein
MVNIFDIKILQEPNCHLDQAIWDRRCNIKTPLTLYKMLTHMISIIVEKQYRVRM